MTTLTEFLLARIAEDEADANLCIHPYGEGVTPPTIFESHDEWPKEREWMQDGWSSDEAPHLSRWSPPRVLAECEAKRRIVEAAQGPEPFRDGAADDGWVIAWASALTFLALPYVDHPDFDEAWRA